ncbi:unnamed protein product [Albugo candida]|uniref:Uncharacterized protein n=1 Tax=Albugo candida TaxID=65357 RepID=A0A024GPW9_9STRA|nr:unnamed protein product [Albugo candida]|eukprot:CCI48601.1 unnamed protein product [Albugo candida]
MSENIEDAAVSDFLRILDEHRKTCERQGKYVEAQVAKNRLQELKFHEHTRRIEAMRSRQIADRLGVEEAHMLELYQFNEAWDRKIQEYQDNIERLEGNLKEKQQNELFAFKEKLTESQSKAKYSKDLLNLRRIEERLVRVKDYTEAHKIKSKADALEAWEITKWQQEKMQEIAQKEYNFKTRQKQDVEALQKRVQAGRSELTKQRQHDLERLLQRYHNVKAELQQQQNLERVRNERFSPLSMRSTLRKKNNETLQLQF